MSFKFSLTGVKVDAVRSTYRNNGNLAVILNDAEDGEQYAVVTVNIEGFDFPDGCTAAIDTNNCGEGIINDLIAAGLIEPEPKGLAPSGFCVYPIHKFNIGKIPEAK